MSVNGAIVQGEGGSMSEYAREFTVLGIAVGINTILTAIDLILRRYDKKGIK
jgi:hypothetical protein